MFTDIADKRRISSGPQPSPMDMQGIGLNLLTVSSIWAVKYSLLAARLPRYSDGSASLTAQASFLTPQLA